MKSLTCLLALLAALPGSARAVSEPPTRQTLVTVKVSTSLPGLSPEAAETRLTNPLEQALRALSTLERMRSTSSEGRSVIWLQLRAATPLAALRQVRHQVSLAAPVLPAELKWPEVVESPDLGWPEPG